MKEYIKNEGYSHVHNISMNIILQDPNLCFDYAIDMNLKKDGTLKKYPKRFLKGELIISKNGWLAFKYARDILNGPFDIGEPTIIYSKNEKLIKAYYNLLKRTVKEKELTNKLKKYPELLTYALDEEPEPNSVFSKFTFPLIRIAKDLVSVQPISAPISFKIKYKK